MRSRGEGQVLVQSAEVRRKLGEPLISIEEEQDDRGGREVRVAEGGGGKEETRI